MEPRALNRCWTSSRVEDARLKCSRGFQALRESHLQPRGPRLAKLTWKSDQRHFGQASSQKVHFCYTPFLVNYLMCCTEQPKGCREQGSTQRAAGNLAVAGAGAGAPKRREQGGVQRRWQVSQDWWNSGCVGPHEKQCKTGPLLVIGSSHWKDSFPGGLAVKSLSAL